MVQSKQALRREIDVLIGEYGTEVISKLVGITERGVQYWVAEKSGKLPSGQRAEKVHELFERHKSGENLRNALESPKNGLTDDYMSEYINLLKEENARIKKRQAESLDVMREVLLMNQAILKTLRNSVAQLIAKQEKTDVLEVAHRLDKETAEYYNLAEKGSRI